MSGLRPLLVAAGLLIAAWLIAPHLAAIPEGVALLGAAQGRWLAAAAAAAAMHYVLAGIALQGAVLQPLSLHSTVRVQLAIAPSAIVVPSGIAGVLINVRYLRRAGLARHEAYTSVTANTLVGFLVHVAALIALAPVALRLGMEVSTDWLWGGLLALATIAAGVLAMPWTRRILRVRLGPAAASLRTVLVRPARAGALVGASAGITCTRGLALAACLAAVGVNLPLLTVVAVYLLAEAAGALASTPGGSGLVEASLLTGLAAAGAAAGAALAGVLAFRLITLWLPALPGLAALYGTRRRGLL